MSAASTKVEIRTVIVSSPSDLAAEQRMVEEAARMLNDILDLLKSDFRLQVRRWETDVPPGPDPLGGQGRIERFLDIPGSDILVAIFWKRFGAPALGFGSGTEREVEVAYESWERSGKPCVMLFFNQVSDNIPATWDEVESIGKILGFKKRWQEKVMTRNYHGKEDFRDTVFRALCQECLGSRSTELLRSEIAFSASCQPETLRAHGLAERVGDMTLGFDGPFSEPAPAELALVIDVRLSVPIAWPAVGPRPTLTAIVIGRPVSIWGVQIDQFTVRFSGVPLTRASLSVRNIRVEANRTNAAMSNYLVPVLARVEARGAALEVPAPVEGLVVGNARMGRLGYVSHKLGPFSAAAGVNAEALARGGKLTAALTVRCAEPFAGWFKNRAEEAGPTDGSPGQDAMSGTRIIIALHGIPNGVEVYVPTRDCPSDGSEGPSLRLVQNSPAALVAQASALPVFAALARSPRGMPLAPLIVEDGHAAAVWEWTGPRLSGDVPRDVELDVIVVAEPGRACPGVATVSCNLAPCFWGYVVRPPDAAIVPSFVGLATDHVAFEFI